MASLGTLVRPLFAVTPSDLPAATTTGAGAGRLTEVVDTVTACCQLTLLDPRPEVVATKLDRYPVELRGFAYEGAGVALAALDTMLPWRQRTREFVAGAAAPYRYAIYLGAGMGLARIRRHPERFRRQLDDDVFGWVVWDGYGFHGGLFAHRRYVQERFLPPNVSGYARCAFDHGLGRSIWFGTSADVDRVADTIAAFPLERRGDLWAGVGLACGYTGAVDRSAVERLRDRAGDDQPRLAEGVAVAAKNRHDVGNPAQQTENACEVLFGTGSETAARLADESLIGLSSDGVEPAYAQWRHRLSSQASHRHCGCQWRLGKTVQRFQCGGQFAEHLISSRSRDDLTRACCQQLLRVDAPSAPRVPVQRVTTIGCGLISLTSAVSHSADHPEMMRPYSSKTRARRVVHSSGYWSSSAGVFREPISR